MPEVRRMRPVLGTYVEVAAHADSLADAERGLRQAFEAIDEVQQRMSFHAPASDLTRLNGAPAGTEVELHPLTLRVLRLARAAMRASGGAFDCTVGGLMVRDGALPDHGGPAPLPRGTDVDIVVGRGRARLRRPLRLTLDGIAKGFAVDQAMACLKAAGAVQATVNIGGDLCVFGREAETVRLRTTADTPAPEIILTDGALASSGGADGWVATRHIDRTRRAHDPRRFACVLASDAMTADALTKVCLDPRPVDLPLLNRYAATALTWDETHGWRSHGDMNG